jgi:hypothetical protein
MKRRAFLGLFGTGVVPLAGRGLTQNAKLPERAGGEIRLPAEWQNVPMEFSMAPFWFWNDRLSEQELARQLDDFQAHGVHAFLIHPRVGLPRDIGWMSKQMISFMRFAVEEAAKRKMWVALYDEGMYPSGSSSGQVVAENQAFRTRGLFQVDLEQAQAGKEYDGIKIGNDGIPEPSAGQNLVTVVRRKADGHRIAIVDRPIQEKYSLIRGLHFLDPEAQRRPDHKEVAEDEPPAADILNPEAVKCFIRLVYQRYYDEFASHFGKTIRAVFTDEPSFLAKKAERGAVAGTTGIIDFIGSWLGYDFTPHLPALWYADEPEAERHRRDYHRALQARLEETFYRPISKWCQDHGVALTGHPAEPDEIGHERHFQIPGQDIVWRYIEPGKPSALEGPQSTQAKCASSAMIHLGRRRNANEFCGAYGHDFTFGEMKWLANWLLVRGCSLLFPHAFYYSVRGPRIDERPPDVGPNSPWWGSFKPFADLCARLCWLNTDSKHICELAILGLNDYLPWRAAKICFERQRDFNYLESRHLWEDAVVDDAGIRIAGMHYRALIVEVEPPQKARPAIEKLTRAGRIIDWRQPTSEEDLITRIDRLVPPDVKVSPSCNGLRVRHVIKGGIHYYVLFNEGQEEINFRLDLSVKQARYLLDTETGRHESLKPDAALRISRHALHVLAVV